MGRLAVRAAQVGLLFACLAAARTVAASPLLDLAGGLTGQGGLQGRTIAGDASAAYFNPALLLDVPAGLSFGVVALTEQIGISLEGRAGASFDVPDGVANATHA